MVIIVIVIVLTPNLLEKVYIRLYLDIEPCITSTNIQQASILIANAGIDLLTKMVKLSCKNAAISRPSETLNTIDTLRGDISRSRYVYRLLEQALTEKKENQARSASKSK